MVKFLARHAAKIVTLVVAGLLYALALPRDIAAVDLSRALPLPKFVVIPLPPADNGRAYASIRQVHPAVRKMDAWISSVGAGIAIADIAGTGRPSDLCLVDPRNDSVTLMPAPDTPGPNGGERFRPFTLPTPVAGYDGRTIAPMGCLPGDFNEDGRTDLLVYYWGRTPVVFLRNDEHELSAAAFTPVEIIRAREVWNTNAAILADVDGDGHPDLVLGNYFPDGARVLDPLASGDFEMQHSMSRAANGGRNRLLLWRSSSRSSVDYHETDAFTAEMANGWTLALAAADLDDDLIEKDTRLGPFKHLPEIYVANDFGPDRLLLNRSTPGRPRFEIVEGRRDFSTPRSKVLGRDSFKGMGVDFGDVTGDGRPAIAVSNIASPYALLESHFLFVHSGDSDAWARGEAPYRDESSRRGTWISGWAWDVKFADLNNNGHPALLQALGFVRGERNRWPELQELAMGNDELLPHPRAWPRFSAGDDLSGNDHDRLFIPDSNGRYHDAWPALGLPGGTVSRGIALGDVYGDGRLAVAIARQWMPSVFLRNVTPDAGRAIVIDLRVSGAVAGSRPAIGAIARVRLASGRVVTSTVDGGSGHGGKRAPEIHLGLGSVPEDTAFDVQISWRDTAGPHTLVTSLKPGRHRILLHAGVAIADASGLEH